MDFVRGRFDGSQPASKPRPAQKRSGPSNLFGAKASKRRASAPPGGASARAGKRSRPGKGSERVKSASKRRVAVGSVEALTFGSVSVGTRMLGCVRKINELDVTVSLPNGLTGFLSLREVSDLVSDRVDAYIQKESRGDDERGAVDSAGGDGEDGGDAKGLKLPSLSDLFEVGQVFPVSVIKLEEKKRARRIELSSRPSQVNAQLEPTDVSPGFVLGASIVSREDRGYVVDVGLDDTPGFLPFPKQGDPPTYALGQLLWVAVSSKRGRTLRVTTARDAVATPKPIPSTARWEALTPGTLLSARITELLANNGLRTSVLGAFKAAAHHTHLPADWATRYGPKQLVEARVLHVDSSNRSISITLLPHLLSLRAFRFPESLKRGVTVEDAKIILAEPKIGFTVALPTEEQNEDDAAAVRGYVHISEVSDDRIDRLGKRFSVGQTVSARVLRLNRLDGWASMSTKPSTLKERFLSYEDVQPGMIVKGKVTGLYPYGALVSLGPAVRALCPTLHLSETSAASPARLRTRFAAGKTLSFRVLSVDAAQRRVALTHKRAMVRSALPPLTSYEAAASRVGSASAVQGFVAAVKPYGLIVEFFNDIHGIVHRSRLGLEDGDDINAAYHKGQPLKCYVLRCDKDKGRLQLSMRPIRASDASSAAAPAFAPGAAIDGVVESYREASAGGGGADANGAASGGRVDTRRYELLVKIKTKPQQASNDDDDDKPAGKTPAEITGVLAAEHLSDDIEHARALMRLYRRSGTRLKRLMVLYTTHTGVPVLTAKPSLISAFARSELPGPEPEGLSPGAVVQGYVANVTGFGVFVRFLGSRLTALSPRKSLTDGYVTDPARFFSVGQSVSCLVVSVSDPVEGKTAPRIIVSLKPSEARLPRRMLRIHTKNWFKEKYLIEAHLVTKARTGKASSANGKSKKQKKTDWSQLTPGAVVRGTVTSASGKTVLVTLESGATGVALTPGAGKRPKTASLAAGTAVWCRVLDVDPVQSIVDVQLLPDTPPSDARSGKGSKSKKKKKKKKAAASWQPGPQRISVSKNDTVSARVALVKRGYVVLETETGEIGYALTKTFNLRLASLTIFDVGARVKVRVARVPQLDDDKRAPASRVAGSLLLFTVDITKRAASQATDAAGAGKLRFFDTKLESLKDLTPGRIVEAKIAGIEGAFAARIAFAPRRRKQSQKKSPVLGRAHVCEWDFKRLLRETDPRDSKNESSGVQAGSAVSDDNAIAVLRSRIGAIVKLRVVERATVRNGGVVELSHVQAASKTAQPAPSNALAAMRPGDQVQGYVDRVSGVGGSMPVVWVNLARGTQARVSALDAAEDPAMLSKLATRLSPGMRVSVRVVRVDSGKGRVDASLLNLKGKITDSASRAVLPVGAVVPARIARVFKAQSYSVQLPRGLSGRCDIAEVTDSWPSDPLSTYSVGTFVRARVLSCELQEDTVPPRYRVDVTLRASRMNSGDATPQAPAVGDLVRGYVRNVSQGIFVNLRDGRIARVRIAQLSDRFIPAEKISEEFPRGALVSGRVLSVGPDDRIELSLKQSVIGGGGSKGGSAGAGAEDLMSWDDFSVGDVVRGLVTSVLDFGAFVRFDRSRVSGLCHRSQIRAKPVKDATTVAKVGTRVSAKIVAKDDEKKRISLSMKPGAVPDDAEPVNAVDSDDDASDSESNDDGEDEQDDSDDDEVMDLDLDGAESQSANAASRPARGRVAKEAREAAAAGLMTAMDVDESDDDDDEDEDEDEDGEDEEESDDDESSGDKPDSDDEDVDDDDDDDSEDDEDDEEVAPLDLSAAKRSADASDAAVANAAASNDPSSSVAEEKSKKRRRTQGSERAAEREVEAAEEALVSQGPPDSVAQFERLVVSSPNSSYIWIKYIAYFVAQAEIGKARAVAERALSVISFREEAEKLNVWTARLNLENLYGTEESLDRALREAVQRCDPLKVYTRCVRILRDTGKSKRAEKLFKVMMKKFRQEPAVWVGFAEFLFAEGRGGDETREALDAATRALPRAQHVPLISKFAQLEFKVGSAERGRTIFEGVLANYPKRVDVWSVYIDMETRHAAAADGERQAATRVAAVRRIMDRATSLNLSTKKMKFLFKKYLAFELKQGDAEAAEAVREKARDYIQRKAGGAAQ